MEADENTPFYCAAPIADVKAPAMDFIPHPPPPYRSPAHADEVREFKIRAYYDLMVAATIPVIRSHWCRLMGDEVRGRSAERVAEMQAERGLR